MILITNNNARTASNMKKIIILVILLAVGWKLYNRASVPTNVPIAESANNVPTIRQVVDTADKHFTCDGRKHCSQMTSCEEATYFLKNCPDTKMDGDHDGIPCEKQFCP